MTKYGAEYKLILTNKTQNGRLHDPNSSVYLNENR